MREPWLQSERVQNVVRDAIHQRYKNSHYHYTLFHEANTRGTPIMRPMWYEFPHDVNTFDLTNQFMYGSSILVAPKMGEQHRPKTFGGPTQVKVYLPKGETWFDYYTKLEVPVQEGQ